MPKDLPQRIRGAFEQTEQAARNMRKHPTPAEAILWRALRGRRLAGLKFRRQHPVGQFIVDFYCANCKLAVEVDGSIHDQQLAYDQARTEQLEAFGCRVLRVSNELVLNDLETVLISITQAVKDRQ